MDKEGLLRRIFLICLKMLLFLISITITQSGGYASAIPTDEYQELADRIKKIEPKYSFDPYGHEGAHKSFDVNGYFNILNRLKVNQGYLIDFVYCALPGYGRPYIYKRDKNSVPFDVKTACAILDDIKWNPDAVEQMTTSYMRAVDVDGSSASLIQFIILYLTGDQFFLFDHARYHDDVLIFSKSKMDQILNSKCPFHIEALPDKIKVEARKIDVIPTFEESKEHDMQHITVKVVTFSLWKGFQRRSFVFNKDMHFYLVRTTTDTIVPYDIGVRF